MARTKHISICPVAVDAFDCDWPAAKLPLAIADSISAADVSQVVQETTFKPLSPLLVSESEVTRLEQIRYALVRDLECEEADRPAEYEKSANALYHLYLGLKVIRPCAGVFQVFHYDLTEGAPRLPRAERNNRETILCDYDVLNSVRWSDLQELMTLAPSILRVVRTPLLPISQAIQNLEIGYRADFANVRHLLWVVGLDALFNSKKRTYREADLTRRRVIDFLGNDFPIYSDQRSPYLPTLIGLSLKDSLSEMYVLRNHFAHGTWPDKQWAGRVCRRSADGTADIYYGDLLAEAASSILRGCLRKILAKDEFVDLFNNKAKMHAHFASRGLMGTPKKSLTTGT